MSSSVSGGMMVLEVDCSPCRSDSWCPQMVAMLFGRCLLMSSGVRPGHVIKLFCFMACMKVRGVGDRHVAYRYIANYCFVCLFLMMTFSLLCSCRI